MSSEGILVSQHLSQRLPPQSVFLLRTLSPSGGMRTHSDEGKRNAATHRPLRLTGEDSPTAPEVVVLERVREPALHRGLLAYSDCRSDRIMWTARTEPFGRRSAVGPRVERTGVVGRSGWRPPSGSGPTPEQ
jgi:hypothetical protein